MAREGFRRLVVTGLPCPPEAWEEFLGKSPSQRILSAAEVYESCPSADVREMSKVVTRAIADFEPHSIVCHDLGVSMTLLSLLRLRRRGVWVNARVTLFNGALRGFNVLKANHVLRVQYWPVESAVREVKAHGGSVDPRLRKHYRRIRAMYRRMVVFSAIDWVTSLTHLEKAIGFLPGSPLGIPMQIIASPNDPFIPFEAIQQLRRDFHVQRFNVVPYGHFPYSGRRDRIVPMIESFESEGLLAGNA